jgi:8-oxo-dGTP pyrophosphatase MutT (NUDIX family)
MKTIELLGDNRHETYTKIREGSRGVIERDGKLLLTYETISGWWLIPGGGLEAGETPAMCCVREVEEETGYIVRPLRKFLTINEYYEEYRYISHYFICEVVGTGNMHLTEQEVRRGVEPAWIPLPEALDEFSKHAAYAAVNEEKRGSYQREYTALCEYSALVENEASEDTSVTERPESPYGYLEYTTADGSVMYYNYKDRRYTLTSQPYEPLIYVKDGETLTCILHMAFNTEELVDAFSEGKTVRAVDWVDYDEKTFCKILATALDSKRSELDYTYAAKLAGEGKAKKWQNEK